MNKLLKPLSLLALLPLLAACSQDENLPAEAEEVTMTFTAQLPAEATTRAEGETPLANTLVVGIYEVITDADPKCVKTDIHTINSNNPEVAVTLIKGKTYKLVFWAYNKPEDKTATSPYSVEDLTAITINNNATSYDAFRGLATAVGGATDNNTSVTLTRPIAQVNIATTVEDYNAAGELGHTPANATLTLTNVPKTYNALKGEVTGNVTISLTFTGSITAPAEGAKDADPVPFVSGYTFAQEPTTADDSETAEAQKIACELEVADNAETPETFFEDEYNIPIQPNYRTNISGRLMTGSVSYTVTLSEGTAGEDNTQVIE